MTNDLPPGEPPREVPPTYSAPAPVPVQPMTPSDEKLYLTLVDIGGIFFSFIPALILYLVAKDRSAFVGRNSASALNFQITMAALQVVNFIVGIILSAVTFGIWGIVQLLIYLAVVVVTIIFSVLAAVAANRAEDYRYPLSFAFVK